MLFAFRFSLFAFRFSLFAFRFSLGSSVLGLRYRDGEAEDDEAAHKERRAQAQRPKLMDLGRCHNLKTWDSRITYEHL